MDFNTTKEAIMAIKIVDNTNKQFVTDVAKYIGYTVPARDCKCKDAYNDLLTKLQLHFRSRDAWCKYKMRNGIVRRGPDGNNIYNLNLTDETAEWLLANDPESSKWITKIVSDESEETSNTINQNETESVSENVSAETTEPEPEPVVVEEPKKKTVRKLKGKTKVSI